MEVAVLGFGLAGVLAAGFLLERFPGAEVVAFEKSRRLGGLLSSAEINGFTFDVGGSHVIFSNDKAVLAEIGLTWRGLRQRRWRAFWSWAWRGSGMCYTWRLGSTDMVTPSTRWTTPKAATQYRGG
jgi:phytoene dehydrogenase-like protein